LKNVLSKAIGSKEDIDFPVQDMQMQDGDLIFLCSDGLHGLVTSEQLLDAATKFSGDLKGFCNTLIQQANEAGGKDNITVVALKYSK
jgi:protein phosphatase